jgi:hypothetical protein
VLTAAAVTALAVVSAAGGSTPTPTQDLTLTSSHRAGHGYPDYSFGIAAASVGGLYPGARNQVRLSFTNPYPYAIRVYAARAAVAGTSRRGCRPTRSNLEVRSYTGRLPFTVPARTSVRTGGFEVHMPNSVSNDCQATTFTLRITGEAAKAGR